MVVAYVALALLAGSLTAVAALLAGYSWSAALIVYVLAGSSGIMVAALLAVVLRPARQVQAAGPPTARASIRPPIGAP